MHEKANHTPATYDANNESLIENIQRIPEDDVALLPDAMDSLYIKLYLIRHATERIMVYYMFDNSDSATLMLNEIISAADRGVKIRLLLNDLNHTFTFQQRWRRELLTTIISLRAAVISRIVSISKIVPVPSMTWISVFVV